MNCKACKYVQRITKNPAARCFKHGIKVLVNRYEKKHSNVIAVKIEVPKKPYKIKGKTYYI
jgi:hypothetical protein